MKAIKNIKVVGSVNFNSQNSSTLEDKKIELTISKGKKKLHKTYSNFKELQLDKDIKDLGVDINKFLTYKEGKIQIISISSPFKSINNLPVSKEFEFTRKSSDKEDVKIKIKVN